MSSTYRMVHQEPSKVVIEMQTVSGWIAVDTAPSVFAGRDVILALKAKEDWVCKIYDEVGNLVGSASASHQPLENA